MCYTQKSNGRQVLVQTSREPDHWPIVILETQTHTGKVIRQVAVVSCVCQVSEFLLSLSSTNFLDEQQRCVEDHSDGKVIMIKFF